MFLSRQLIFLNSKPKSNLFRYFCDSSISKDEDVRKLGVITENNNRYVNKKDSRLQSFRPHEVNADETSVILFPGQGTAYVGMGQKLLQNEKSMKFFSKAKDILGYDLMKMCLNGPLHELTKTVYSQPAIFVTSLAAVELLRESIPGAIESTIAVAGYSLGEYSALVFSGAISFEDGLRLVKLRAEAMQNACNEMESGLLTCIFSNDAKVDFMCKAASKHLIRTGVAPEDAICSVSSYLMPHCCVIGGHIEALNFIRSKASDFGIKRTQLLKVSGAFHTDCMVNAVKPVSEALKRININVPNIATYSNVNRQPYISAENIRELLTQQLVKPVKWMQTMETIYSRPSEQQYPWTFEVGPGSSLRTITNVCNRKVYKKMISLSV